MTYCGTKYNYICLGICIGINILILISYPIINMVVKSVITNNLILKNESPLFQIWSKPTNSKIEIYTQIYIFDLLNAEQFLKGDKPSFVQRGPYTYLEKLKKVDILHNANATITYRQIKTYHFLEDLSVGPDSQLFTTVNIVMMVFSDLSKGMSPRIRSIINFILESFKERGVLTLSVHELIWGYNDPILTDLCKFFPKFCSISKIGFLAGKNNTDDGLYTIYNGENDINMLGYINKYNGLDHLPYWTSVKANRIFGTDGSIHPPFVNKKTILNMFQSMIFRSCNATYDRSYLSKDGIQLMSFVAAIDTFDAPSEEHPRLNEGFCTPRTNCLPSGVMNLSKCIEIDNLHIPIVVSFPHFYLGNRSLLDAIAGGLNPDSSMQTHLDLEPLTGIVFREQKKLQINLYVKRNKDLKGMKTIRELIFPILFLNESVSIDSTTAKMFKGKLKILNIISIAQYSIFILFTSIAFVCCIFLIVQHTKLKKISGDYLNTNEFLNERSLLIT